MPPALKHTNLGDKLTTAQVAAQLGLSMRTVSKHALKMGCPKVGHTFLMTPAQVNQLRALMTDPNKRGPKPASVLLDK